MNRATAIDLAEHHEVWESSVDNLKKRAMAKV